MNLYMLMQYNKQDTIQKLTPKSRTLEITPLEPSTDPGSLARHIKDLLQLITHGLQSQEHITLRSNKTKYTYPTPFSLHANQNNYTFHIVIHVLNVIQYSLQQDGTRTLRSVFYDNVPIFRTQKRCVHWLNKICYLLSVKCVDVGIVPSLKGLVYCHGAEVCVDDVWLRNEIRLIPRLTHDSKVTLSEPCRIIVVEKDAIFHSLVGQVNERTAHCVIITGKGYPDRNTVQFLQLLQECCVQPPTHKIQLACDEDPHGVHITWQYLKRLNSWQNVCCTRPGGVSRTVRSNTLPQQLTSRDISLAQNLLVEIPHCNLRRELQRILVFNKKYEMSADSILSHCPTAPNQMLSQRAKQHVTLKLPTLQFESHQKKKTKQKNEK